MPYSVSIILIITILLFTGCDTSPAAPEPAPGDGTTVDTSQIIREKLRDNIVFTLYMRSYPGEKHYISCDIGVPREYEHFDFSNTTIDIEGSDTSFVADSIGIDSNFTSYGKYTAGYSLFEWDTQLFYEEELVSVTVGNPYWGFFTENIIVPKTPEILSVHPAISLGQKEIPDTVVVHYTGESNFAVTTIVLRVKDQKGTYHRYFDVESSPCSLAVASFVDEYQYGDIEQISLFIRSGVEANFGGEENFRLFYTGNYSDEYIVTTE